MKRITVTDELYKEIKDYCELNNLQINDMINKLLKKAFITEKYGDIPFGYIEASYPNTETQKLNNKVVSVQENSMDIELLDNKEKKKRRL